MQKGFFDKIAFFGFLFSIIVAVICMALRHFAWAFGVITASCWMFLNVFFLYKLLEASMLINVPKHPGRLLLLTVLKFPAIYLAGFFILKTRYFPMESILTGMSLFFLALGVSWLAQKKVARSAVSVLFLFCSLSMTHHAPSVCYASETHEVHASTQEAHEGHGHPQTINWVSLLAQVFAPSPFSDFLMRWEKAIFTLMVVLIIAFLSLSVSKNIQRVPGRFQGFMEMIISGLDSLVQGVIGPQGRAYTPFLGSLFIYILISNLLGLFPLQNSILAYITSVIPITICVFLYVQWVGISKNGPVGYFLHLCGSPRDAFGWIMAPLMFPLHVLGEFIKPLSLTFRLYGNIMSGHLLLAVFLGMGVSMLKSLKIPAGIPIHFPFLFLEILVGVIQAFVFTLLSTIYIAMMLPHEHEHEHGSKEHVVEQGVTH